MLFPASGVEVSPSLLLGMGVIVGVCSGFFGFGGGFMMTPALNMFGFPMAYAIGTDLTQMAGSAAISTMKHRKLGHVDLRLGIIMILGTVAGVEAGKHLVMYMEGMGNVDSVVRYIYIALLAGLGMYMFMEARKAASAHSPREASESGGAEITPLVLKIRSLKLPPYICLPASGIEKLSVWVLISIGFATGILAGLLGVGGGFIRMPALVYLMGVPTVVAVGTDLFEIIISGSYGAFTYAIAGRVEIMAAILILIGSSAGIQIGATATRYIHGAKIRQYFSFVILLAGVAVAIKEVGFIFSLAWLETPAICLLVGVVGVMSLLITVMFIKAKINSKDMSYAEKIDY